MAWDCGLPLQYHRVQTHCYGQRCTFLVAHTYSSPHVQPVSNAGKRPMNAVLPPFVVYCCVVPRLSILLWYLPPVWALFLGR